MTDTKRRPSIAIARRQLARLTARIAKDRDALRELIEEMEPLKESCDEAVDDLERAADVLSRYA